MKKERLGIGLLVSFAMLCGIGFIPSTLSTAIAAGYPDRSISLVVPFAPGGMIDTSARAFAEYLQRQVKQPVVVVNKTGGGQAVGGKYVVNSEPDGYTLGFFTFGAGSPEAYKSIRKPAYSGDDLLPVARIMSSSTSIAAKGDAPYNNLKELIVFARKNPGMKVGSQGPEASGWLFLDNVISKAEGVKFINVPFAGGSRIIAALLGGHVGLGTPDYIAVKPLRGENKLKPLAILSNKRSEFAKDVPTVVEQGYPFPAALQSPIGIFAPKGTPNDILKKLEALALKVTEDPGFQALCDKMSMQISYENAATFTKTRTEHMNSIQAMLEERSAAKK